MWEWGCPLESLTNLRNIFLINIKRNYKIPEEECRFRSSKLLISLNPTFFPRLRFSSVPGTNPRWISVSLETEQCWFASCVANRDRFLQPSLSLWGQIWGRDLSHQFGYHRAQNIEFRDRNLTVALLFSSSKTFSKALLFTDLQPPLPLKKTCGKEFLSLLVVKH